MKKQIRSSCFQGGIKERNKACLEKNQPGQTNRFEKITTPFSNFALGDGYPETFKNEQALAFLFFVSKQSFTKEYRDKIERIFYSNHMDTDQVI